VVWHVINLLFMLNHLEQMKRIMVIFFGGQDAGDDDMVIFFGGANLDTIEDRKRLKLSRKCQMPGWISQN
jgi:hypothetical protein